MNRAEILERLTNLDEVIDYTEKRIERNANWYNEVLSIDLWNNAEILKKRIRRDKKRLVYLNLGFQMLLHDLNKSERQRTIESKEFQEWQIYLKAELQSIKLKKQL
jgi:hypothetical protein